MSEQSEQPSTTPSATATLEKPPTPSKGGWKDIHHLLEQDETGDPMKTNIGKLMSAPPGAVPGPREKHTKGFGNWQVQDAKFKGTQSETTPKPAIIVPRKSR